MWLHHPVTMMGSHTVIMAVSCVGYVWSLRLCMRAGQTAGKTRRARDGGEDGGPAHERGPTSPPSRSFAALKTVCNATERDRFATRSARAPSGKRGGDGKARMWTGRGQAHTRALCMAPARPIHLRICTME